MKSASEHFQEQIIIHNFPTQLILNLRGENKYANVWVDLQKRYDEFQDEILYMIISS